MRAYTDYPFDFLGDTDGEYAPIREVKILYYDQDKRCTLIVEGVETEVKRGYLYTQPVRLEEAIEKDLQIDTRKCKDQFGRYKSSKAAQITVKWIVYPPNYKPSDGYKKYQNLNKAWRYACQLGVGAEVVQDKKVSKRDGSSSSYSDFYYVVEE